MASFSHFNTPIKYGSDVRVTVKYEGMRRGHVEISAEIKSIHESPNCSTTLNVTTGNGTIILHEVFEKEQRARDEFSVRLQIQSKNDKAERKKLLLSKKVHEIQLERHMHQSLGTTLDNDLIITSIKNGSLCDGKMEVGDQIIRVNDYPCEDSIDVSTALALVKNNFTITVARMDEDTQERIRRLADEKKKEKQDENKMPPLTILPRRGPVPSTNPKTHETIDVLVELNYNQDIGVNLQKMCSAIVVKEIAKGGGAMNRLKIGDELKMVNNVEIRTEDEVYLACKRSGPVIKFTVSRDIRTAQKEDEKQKEKSLENIRKPESSHHINQNPRKSVIAGPGRATNTSADQPTIPDVNQDITGEDQIGSKNASTVNTTAALILNQDLPMASSSTSSTSSAESQSIQKEILNSRNAAIENTVNTDDLSRLTVETETSEDKDTQDLNWFFSPLQNDIPLVKPVSLTGKPKASDVSGTRKGRKRSHSSKKSCTMHIDSGSSAANETPSVIANEESLLKLCFYNVNRTKVSKKNLEAVIRNKGVEGEIRFEEPKRLPLKGNKFSINFSIQQKYESTLDLKNNWQTIFSIKAFETDDPFIWRSMSELDFVDTLLFTTLSTIRGAIKLPENIDDLRIDGARKHIIQTRSGNDVIFKLKSVRSFRKHNEE
ncbi:hypothetical protein GCK72_005814 [Caenorhabditis remanei]|uniref:PDZ domain-containing protein n=1 Tax=Caenorhabditis remanei TaxID=31234 RepID=A0A6A5HFT4_CAERE|nr:hypothetical protein GCK72_005814 [Caenorhabditis remanei]KAF1765861.1 hypothetical protein GCK72_005814 [Caenorhabditis remanei]